MTPSGTTHAVPPSISHPPGAVASVMRPIALLAMGAGLIRNEADPDLWGHLRFGLDIIRDRALYSTDPYSYTSDREWINHGWLPELLAGVFYRLAGTAGLAAMKALIAAGLFWLVWGAVRDRQFVWRWSAMAMAAFAALPILLTNRPQLWTTLGIVIVCRVLISSSRRAVWILPPLFALWANLHGGWLVGGGVVALWTAVAFVRRDPRAWQLVAAGACSLVATLLQPYGLELWRFLAETVRFGRADISEWQPIWHLGLDSVVLWMATLVFIGVSLKLARWPSVETILVLAALAIAGARVDRLGPLFGLAAVTLLAVTWPATKSTEASQPGRTLLDALGVTIGLGFILFSAQASPACLRTDPANGPDTVAAESLRGKSGRLVTFFDWGEYAIWHFGPDLRVSIDGRRETAYSETILQTQRAVLDGTEAGLAELKRTRPEYVWLPAAAARTKAWLRANGYRIDIETSRSYVAARADLPLLAPWSGVTSGCFPGP